jgi:nucleotide-binding universal stress UspA family protein
MFKKILLPVDLSDKHDQAIESATALASQSRGDVVLLHVIDTIAGLSMDEEKAFYTRLQKAAEKHLAKLAGKLKSRKVPCHVDVLFGHRAPEVVRHANKIGADLIVLTAPRLDPDNPAVGWGSLSYKISILSGSPVLLVK